MKIETLSLLIKICMISIILVVLPISAEETQSAKQSTEQTDLPVINEAEQVKIDAQIDKKREEITDEAVAAIKKTENALIALENKNKDKAIEALEDALGELEVILVRNPNLAFAPIDTRIAIHHSNITLKSIKQIKEKALNHLENNEVQKARTLLNNLASEVVLSVVSIPLATYPDVIKDIVPLIDAGKLENAQFALRAALNSMTVTDYVFPIPIMRTDKIIEKAQALMKKTSRTNADNEALSRSVADARLQLQIAETLGYGSKDEYRGIYNQLDELEKTIGGNVPPRSDLFDEIRQIFSEYLEPFNK